MMLRTTLLSAAASLLVGASTYAQSFPAVTNLPAELVEPEAATPLNGADAIAVHEAVTRVYLAEDSRNGDALKQLVTEDFIQDHAIFGRLTGAENFANWVLDNPSYFDRYRHMAMNIVTRATEEGQAEAVSYILVLDLHPAGGGEAAARPGILGHGIVRDRLVKQGNRWRIAYRAYDQFAVAAAIVPDEATRLNAARTLSVADSN